VLRAIFYFLGAVLVISMVRGVIGAIARLFTEFTGTAETAGSPGTRNTAQPQRPAVPISEALKRDPVCGAFVAPSTSVQKTVGNSVQYFCSTDCRDKFAG
jgi:YHS domain-containing protein